MNYAAVTGDLVSSRRLSPKVREKVQETVLAALEELNHELEEQLVMPSILVAGDEVQAIFRSPSAAVEFMRSLKDTLFGSAAPGQDIVFGVGWGGLTTGPPGSAADVGQLDGPCFHLAREMLLSAKKKRIWAEFRGFGDVEDQALSSIFGLMGAIRRGWTATQSIYTVALRRLGKRIRVAEKFGVNPSVITESLQASDFEAILAGEEAARRVLAEFDPKESA